MGPCAGRHIFVWPLRYPTCVIDVVGVARIGSNADLFEVGGATSFDIDDESVHCTFLRVSAPTPPPNSDPSGRPVFNRGPSSTF